MIQFEVSVVCGFDFEDDDTAASAVACMAEWLAKDAHKAVYDVKWTDANGVAHKESIDAGGLNV